VPEGNYDNKKIIIGTASNKELSKIDYVDAFEKLVISVEQEIANNLRWTETEIERYDLTVLPNHNTKYNRIALQFTIDSLQLRDLSTRVGTYGFALNFLNGKGNSLFLVTV
jgi:hypothetical protein